MRNWLLLHNIGHHDVYFLLKRAENEPILVKPRNIFMYSIGKHVWSAFEKNAITFTRDDERNDKFTFKEPIDIMPIIGKSVEHRKELVTLKEGDQITGIVLPLAIPVIEEFLAQEEKKNAEARRKKEKEEAKKEANNIENSENSVPEESKEEEAPLKVDFFVHLLSKGNDGDNETKEEAVKNKGKKDKGRSTRYIANIVRYILENTYVDIEFSSSHDDGEKETENKEDKEDKEDKDKKSKKSKEKENQDDFSFYGRASFFRTKILPRIHDVRRQVVEHYYRAGKKEDWKENFSLYLSLNTGTTSAIISTLNALRAYQADFLHVQKVYSWPEEPFKAECISHQKFQQSPAISSEIITEEEIIFAIEEMRKWKKDFVSIRGTVREWEKEKPTFFFRKGKQEVLAVVVVREPEGNKSFIVHRGVNLEVSLPTGSLCAERNAIGSALAANPELKRENILCVAVLSLGKKGPTLGPCGACREWLLKVAEVNPDFSVLTFEDEDCTKTYIETIPVT